VQIPKPTDADKALDHAGALAPKKPKTKPN